MLLISKPAQFEGELPLELLEAGAQGGQAPAPSALHVVVEGLGVTTVFTTGLTPV